MPEVADGHKTGVASPETWPRRLLRWRGEIVAAWTAVSGLPVWLASIRSLMEGTDYAWGLGSIGGRGLQEFLMPLPLAVVLVLVLYSMYRRWGPFPLLVLGWHALVAAFFLTGFLGDPGGLRFRGDTLGIDVPLGYPALAGFAAISLLVLWWARDMMRQPQREVRRWSRRNWVLLAAVVVMLPYQFWLFSSGDQHGRMDQVGVLQTIAQYLALNVGLGHTRKQPRP